MATKKELLDELNFLSDKISTSVWTLDLGMLAFAWSLLIASGDMRFTVRNAIWVMIPSLLALIAHMLQYLFGYVVARRIYRELRDSRPKRF
jgi:hypothetical protein